MGAVGSPALLIREVGAMARQVDLEDQAPDRIPDQMRAEFQRHPHRSAEPSQAPRDQQAGYALPVRCVLGSYLRVLERERKSTRISMCDLFGRRPT